MKFLIRSFTPLCVLCFAHSAAHADDLQIKNNWYMGLQLLAGFENLNDSGGALPYDDAIGLGAKFGLRIDALSDVVDFSVETNINSYSSNDIKHIFGVGGVPGQTYRTLESSLMVRTKLNMTNLLGGYVEPYGYAGLGYVQGKTVEIFTGAELDTSNIFAIEFGGGIEIPTSDSVAAFVEFGYLSAAGDPNDTPFAIVATGFIFKF